MDIFICVAIVHKNDKVTLRIGKHMTMELADVEAAVAFIDDSMLQVLNPTPADNGPHGGW